MTQQFNPWDEVKPDLENAMRARNVRNILESYNDNYDVLVELLQNSVDALEDAYLKGLPDPLFLQVIVNLSKNWVGVLDTGIGMSPKEVRTAFVPTETRKDIDFDSQGGGRAVPYRGYKGVGMTFLAFSTNEIKIHSKAADNGFIRQHSAMAGHGPTVKRRVSQRSLPRTSLRFWKTVSEEPMCRWLSLSTQGQKASDPSREMLNLGLRFSGLELLLDKSCSTDRRVFDQKLK